MSNSVNVTKVEYAGWPNNLRLEGGGLELMVSLDVGPRILKFGLAGSESVFGEFSEQLGGSHEKTWMLRGGHRLWIAPEHKPRTYELDNEPVDWQQTGRGVTIVQRPGLLTGIRKSIEIELEPSVPFVRVTHILTNANTTPVDCAPWGLSVMATKGTAIIPLPPLVAHEEKCTPNQNWSIWSYTDLADPRLKIGTRCVLVRQDPARGPLKLGMAEREGWAAYHVNGMLFVKWFGRDETARYPDGDVNFEVYTDKRILEMETLGTLVTLQPGESAKHGECWTLDRLQGSIRNDDDAQKLVVPIVEQRRLDVR